MLPERLSNGLCSLNPRVDRLVLSAILELDAKGRVVGSDFAKGVIRSAHRMTYTEIARLLETALTAEDEHRYGPFLGRLPARWASSRPLLRARREARGSIDFDLPDADVVLDDAGLVVGIVPESRNVAHRLIEEFMLAANEAVAKKLLFAKQPAIYRVHDRPDPDRLVDLRDVLESFGYALKGDLAELRAEGVPASAPARSRASPRNASCTTSCCAPRARPSTARSAAATTRSRRPTTATSRPRSAGTRTSSCTGSSRGCWRRSAPFPPKDFEAINAAPRRDRDVLLGARAARRAGRAREPALEEDRLHEGQGRPRVRRLPRPVWHPSACS